MVCAEVLRKALAGDKVAVAWLIEQYELEAERLGLRKAGT